MTRGILLACGEVPWERALLTAAADARVRVVRRLVDLGGLVQAAEADTTGATVIVSPALRDFAERGLHAVAATGRRVLVLVDDIEPPWLTGAGFATIRVDGLAWPTLFDDLPAATAPAVDLRVLAGVSGGVGVTTLAAVEAARAEGSLLIDAALARPSIAFLLGMPAASSGLIDALERDEPVGPGVLTLAPAAAPRVTWDALEALLLRLAPSVTRVIVDAGTVDAPLAGPLLAAAAHPCLVSSGTPLGLLRLCTLAERADDAPVTLVVNGLRAPALGTGRADTVARRIVEEATGRTPLLLPDVSAACDAAWLRGSVRALVDVLPALVPNPARIAA